MKKKQWKKKYRELYKKYIILNQSSLNHCNKCAWNTVLPNDVCLVCEYWEREEKKDQLGRTLPLEGHKEDCPHGQTGWATCTCDCP